MSILYNRSTTWGGSSQPEADRPLDEVGMYCIYFAKSLRNNKIYVGYTSKDPNERVKEHNQGSTPWTRNNKPFALVYYEEYLCKEDVIAREKFYKSGIGKKVKKAIISAMGW